MLLSCPALIIKNLVTFRVGNVYHIAKIISPVLVYMSLNFSKTVCHNPASQLYRAVIVSAVMI